MANENVYVGETGAKQLYQRVKGLVSGTIPRVDGAVEGNISVLAGDGSLTDSGISGSSVGDALTKLEGVESGAQVNVIESVEVAGTALVITGKAVNIPDADVDVKGVVRLTSDPTSEAENTAATPEAIRRALANFGGFMVVQLDPETRQPDVDSPSTKYIYLTKEDPSAKTDPYTEWIWIEPESGEQPYWDVIGEASVDLSGYVQKVSGATEGNLGSLAADGGLADSGISGNSVSDAVSKTHAHDNKAVLDQVEEPYTTAEKNKLGGIATGAQVNTIESISVNGTAVNPDANKNVAISIPKSVPDPSASNQMLFSVDGSTWVPMTWETISFNTVTISGKQYTTATVGSQIWLVGNLDLTWDGLVPSETGTAYLNEPRANYYSDDESTYGWNGKKYGLLYNWAAVRYMDEHANTLFEGWHVPTSDEWNTLKQSLGASGAYELMTTTEWTAGNGSDLYGFSAVPSGIRGASPSYSYGGNGARANFWTKTHPGDSKTVATMWTMRGDNGAFYYDDGAFKDTQGSVRLVKDV